MWKSQNTRFIFSPEAAAESLPTCSKESRPCALSKSWSTREPSSACASPACRYGTTCEPSAPTILSAPECSQTFENTAMTLSLPGAFLAKIFHAREKARAYAAREADFGRSLRVSFAKFDPATYSWKIPRFLFQGDWATFSPTWPRYGMMVHTVSCRQVPSGADIGETVSGEHSGEEHEKQNVETNEKRGVVLSILRKEDGTAAQCRWSFGGLQPIFQTEVLLDEVPGQSGSKAGSETLSVALARAEVEAGVLRTLQFKEELASTPQRPQRGEQCAGELADTLRELSRTFAQTGATGTFEFSAEVNCYKTKPWVADTGVTAFGELSGGGIETAQESALWPTVTVHGNGNRSEYGGKSGDGLDTAVKRAGAVSATEPTPTCAGLDGGSNSRRAARARGRYIEGAGAKSATGPTPTVHDKIRGQVAAHGREKRQGYGTQGNLNDEVVRRAESAPWPTPKARDCDPTSRNQKPRDDLKCAVEMGRTKSHTYPTIGTKTMGGCSGSFAKLKELEGIGCLTPEERRAMSSHLTGGKDPERADCGMLNPDWVEWLMDWPIWWTDVDFRNTDGWRCRFVWLDPADDPADWPTPLMERITRRKTNRVNRIETLGNGQVPLCAAVAFVFAFEILEVAIYTERKAA